jgi:hypothetical protein
MTTRRNKPEWVRDTPRDNYLRAVCDAFLYARVGRLVIIPENPMKQDRGYWAGIVAFDYGVSLMPAGRD